MAGLTRPYQIERNPHNLAYAAPVAFSLQAKIGYGFALGAKAYGQLGLSLMHFSNGSFKRPNVGVNLPNIYLTVGTGWLRGGMGPYMRRNRLLDTTARPRHLLDVTGAVGWKSFSTTPAPLYLNTLARVAYRWAYGVRGDLAVGFDWNNNPALKEGLPLIGKTHSDYNRLSLTVGHEWYLSRQIAISTHAGVYVRDPVPIDDPWYQRYGVRFAARRRLQPAVWVRAHLGTADCVEFALTYSWLRLK